MATAASGKGAIPLSFSHIGIHVTDLPRMEDFYTRALGFTVTDRGTARGFPIVFTTWNPHEHHQFVLVGGKPDQMPYNIINQMSFRVAKLEDVQEIHRRVKDEPGVHDLYGTNHGNAWSMYFRDPEGNRVEIFCDSPWYVDQPCIVSLDLARPADEIRAESEAWCRTQPGFKSAADYTKVLAAKIEAHSGVRLE